MHDGKACYWDVDRGKLHQVRELPVDRERLDEWKERMDQDDFIEIMSLKGHTEPVRALAFNPASTEVATAGDDIQVLVWCLSPNPNPNPNWTYRFSSGAFLPWKSSSSLVPVSLSFLSVKGSTSRETQNHPSFIFKMAHEASGAEGNGPLVEAGVATFTAGTHHI